MADSKDTPLLVVIILSLVMQTLPIVGQSLVYNYADDRNL